MDNFITTLVRWGFAFLIGSVLGLMAEQIIISNTIKKDCEILGAFRINNSAYTCKFMRS